jgi:hypothetical protein
LLLFGSTQLCGYKKAMIQNLEFIADKEAFKKIDDKSLSANLLKITTKKIVLLSPIILSIINQKTNYVKQKSIKKNQFLEICFMLPALVALFLFQVKVIAQEKESEFKISNAPITVSLHVTSKSTQQDLEAEKDSLKRLME